VSCPPTGGILFASLAERLGQQVDHERARLDSWRMLERAIQILSLERTQIVLAIDDCHGADGAVRRELEFLVHLGSGIHTELTIIELHRADLILASGSWGLAIGLKALTRSQASQFLTVKLEAAGCTEAVFTPRSITRLHALSQGNPRELERLAALSLMAGASRRLEFTPADLVDAVAGERRTELCAAASYTSVQP
jgi:hypothetical protein